MNLVFCCPVCGANLRTPRSAGITVVACSGCAEPIHVPKFAHPIESIVSDPIIPSGDIKQACDGIYLTSRSVVLFLMAGFFAVLILTLRTSLGLQPRESSSTTVITMLMTCAFLWIALAWSGCLIRFLGYGRCRQAAHYLGVENWTKLAMAGSVFTAVGELAMVPWLLGYPLQALPPEAAAIVLIGLLAGAVGCAMEFGFMTTLHRFLWETSGWQAANRTGGFAVTFVFATMAGLFTMCLGAAIAAVTAQQQGQAGPVPPPIGPIIPLPEKLHYVAMGIIVILSAIVVHVCRRYLQLLHFTERSLSTPEPYPQQQKITPTDW